MLIINIIIALTHLSEWTGEWSDELCVDKPGDQGNESIRQQGRAGYCTVQPTAALEQLTNNSTHSDACNG